MLDASEHILGECSVCGIKSKVASGPTACTDASLQKQGLCHVAQTLYDCAQQEDKRQDCLLFSPLGYSPGPYWRQLRLVGSLVFIALTIYTLGNPQYV